ncbi:MAG: hypothetical protein J7L55_05770 [Desulfurococcales archaeon]|nr:hypothetical protein [Desulfurococcales archaeon]
MVADKVVTKAEWRRALREVQGFLADELRGWGSADLKDFVRVRVSGALEVIVRSDEKVGSIIIRGAGGTAIIASSRFLRGGAHRLVKVETPDGYEVKIPVGVPSGEGFHVTQVGAYGMKCTCQDSVMTASKADREFIDALKELGLTEYLSSLVFPLFSRFVICKHTLALMSYLIASGVLTLEDPEVRRTLKLALIGAALKSMGHKDLGNGKVFEALKLLLAERE